MKKRVRWMSKIYSKTDKGYIVKELVEYLRECEDGTDITTCQLLRKVCPIKISRTCTDDIIFIL